MKKIICFLSLLSVMALPSCLKDKLTKTYTVLEPVYKDKAEVLAAIGSSTATEIASPGKIYQYGNYIFLNEINKGVHIIDNSNPSSPVQKAFIQIPGNIDIAVKGNTLYADLYTDMLAIDITDPLHTRLLKVLPKIFPERFYSNGFIPDTTKVIVDWISKKVTVPLDDPGNAWPCANCMFFDMSLRSGPASAAAAPGVAAGGSMARFAIVNNNLYAVNNSFLKIIDISNTPDPVETGSYYAGWNIETIYPFKQKLFLGSSSGMFVFNINNPSSPVREGSFSHARACDPVVADDNYAFVTLRTGTFCSGTNNELDVINIQNVLSPSLVKMYSMTNPFGLAKDGNLLFVCDGKSGLKIYNASDVMNLQMIKHIKDYETYDVIAGNSRLLLVAKDGLYQYDYSNVNNIRQLSRIEITTNK
ncbi:MAG: hypothetical protein ABUL41_02495 [Chitinophagaceae bacterium]